MNKIVMLILNSIWLVLSLICVVLNLQMGSIVASIAWGMVCMCNIILIIGSVAMLTKSDKKPATEK